jgi:hypothetical protein
MCSSQVDKNFIKRTLSLDARLERTCECPRSFCEDPDTIKAWFGLAKNTINKHDKTIIVNKKRNNDNETSPRHRRGDHPR